MNDNKKYTIGVLIGGVHTYFPKQLMAGIRSAAKDLDINVYYFLGSHTKLFLQNVLADDMDHIYDYQFNTIYDYSLISGLDGFIINYGTLGIYLEKNDISAFIEKYNSLPTVVLTETTVAGNCHHLISDNYGGITLLMKHLIEDHGYTKILFVSGPLDNTDAIERRQAYLDSMDAFHLPFQEDMMVTGDFSEFVEKQVEMLLDHHPDAQAIVFANDEMAFSGYRVCAKRGLQVGKDIAITGYDDCEMSQTMIPPLTTIGQDGYEMGQQAVFDLIDRFRGKSVSSRRIPVRFICRESCGCPADIHAAAAPISLPEKYLGLKKKLAAMHQEHVNFQRKSWFMPFFARDINDYANDEEQFCRQIMVNLRKICSNNMYLFLLQTPISYVSGDVWTTPKDLYLASFSRRNQVVSYYPYDRPHVSTAHPISEYIAGTCNHQYTFFLLFSSEKQYGLLACDIEQTDFSFFYMLSLQLGLSLRYLESSKKEAAHLQEMSRNIETIREQNRILDLMSGYDELTGLLNLRGFMEQAKSICRSHCQQAYMIYADLDHLKEINDNWGHSEGNYAIRSAGKILKNCLRDTDVLGRIGGDEFIAMVISEAESFEEIFRKRLKLACQELNETSGKPFYVEITVGLHPFVCCLDTDLQKIISQADSALYTHKKYRRPSVRRT